jgi:hypothetical protein
VISVSPWFIILLVAQMRAHLRNTSRSENLNSEIFFCVSNPLRGFELKALRIYTRKRATPP